MKKFLALLLAAVMMLSLAACGNTNEPVEDPTDEPVVDEPVESRPNRLIYGSTTEISDHLQPGRRTHC